MSGFEKSAKQPIAERADSSADAAAHLSSQLNSYPQSSADSASANGQALKHSMADASAKLVNQDLLPALDAPSGAENVAKAMENAIGTDYHFRTGATDAFSDHPSGKSPTSAWDMGQVLESDAELAKLTHSGTNIDRDIRAMNRYWDTSKGGPAGFDSGFDGTKPSGDKYYDDNNWMGIGLLDSNNQHPDTKDVEGAKNVFQLILKGAHDAETLPHPGGVLWTQQAGNEYRATVSTAGAAQLGLRLYEQTKDSDPKQAQGYLDFATKEFNWVDQNVKASNGLYADGMNADGSISDAQYTYNQGLMLGDATMLYKATGDQKYLTEAKDIADKSIDHFDGAGFQNENTMFNAVFFKNLMLLDSVERATPGQSANPAYRETLKNYAQFLYSEVDPKTSVITTIENGQPDQNLLSQAAAVQLFSLAQENPVS